MGVPDTPAAGATGHAPAAGLLEAVGPLLALTAGRGLVLDLSGLDFFGTEGFSALHRVSVLCARVGTGWAMVPGAAVTRVLWICDPQGSLPTANTVEGAMATFPGLPSQRLQLITNPTRTR